MGLTLQENLMEFTPYNIDFKIQNGWFIIGLEFNDEWTVIEPQNQKIEHVQTNGKHYYGAKLEDNLILDETFDLIRLTISYNKDLEKKINLFQEKVKELQDFFAEENYEDLLNLEFIIKTPPKKRKKKEKAAIKQDNTINEEIKETLDNEKEIKIFE